MTWRVVLWTMLSAGSSARMCVGWVMNDLARVMIGPGIVAENNMV